MVYPTGQLLCAGPPHLQSPTDVQPPPGSPLPQSRRFHKHSHPSQQSQEQRALYLKAKVVVGEVSVVDDGRVQALAGNNKIDL